MRCFPWLPVLMVICPLAVAAAPADHTGDDGWVTLFDGKTLNGWVQRGGQAKYEVVDGTIQGTSVPNTENSFLCTEKTYGDFVLHVEFRVDPELNSGVQIRSNSLAEYRNGRVHGYQVEIDPSDRGWSGGIYDEARRGWLNSLEQNKRARYAFRPGQWNTRSISKRSAIRSERGSTMSLPPISSTR